MARKKIKKFLKNAAPLLGAAGLAMMLGGRKGKAFTNANARKLMTSNAAMRGLPKGGVTGLFGGGDKMTAITQIASEMGIDPKVLGHVNKAHQQILKEGFEVII